MKNSFINRAVVVKIATALADLNNRVAYVGGAVVSLYADDPAADDVRPTKDLDITLEIASLADLAALQEELSKKGFKPAPEEKVICRFKYQDILVDVMATTPVGWAPSNEWFKPGFEHLQTVSMDGVNIRILPVTYFLATKFSAFHSRGGDARTSHDFEDIVYILDNRIDLVQEVMNANAPVKTYLKNQFGEILKQNHLQEAILAHLYYQTQTTRYKMIMSKLKTIVKT